VKGGTEVCLRGFSLEERTVFRKEIRVEWGKSIFRKRNPSRALARRTERLKGEAFFEKETGLPERKGLQGGGALASEVTDVAKRNPFGTRTRSSLPWLKQRTLFRPWRGTAAWNREIFGRDTA